MTILCILCLLCCLMMFLVGLIGTIAMFVEGDGELFFAPFIAVLFYFIMGSPLGFLVYGEETRPVENGEYQLTEQQGEYLVVLKGDTLNRNRENMLITGVRSCADIANGEYGIWATENYDINMFNFTRHIGSTSYKMFNHKGERLR